MSDVYISPLGADTLRWLRPCDVPDPVGRPPIEMIASLPSEDCGCPEEVWSIHGIIYVIHFESDGSGELTSFEGEDDAQQTPYDDVQDMNHLRVKMFEYHAALIVEE